MRSAHQCHAHLSDHKYALIACQQAITLHQKLGRRDGLAATWDSCWQGEVLGLQWKTWTWMNV
jgi:hypothetical protein